MKRYLAFLVVIFIICSGLLFSCSATPNPTPFKVEINGIEYSYNDIEKLEILIEEQKGLQQTAQDMAECARTLGEPENSPVIKSAQSHWHAAQDKINLYNQAIQDINKHWNQKHNEYPAATYIWETLKQAGYNDYVCAGIMGNIMNEVGGNTLALQPTIYGKGYYGICQWSKGYAQIWGASLEEQCKFLLGNIKYELNTYGSLYRKGFNYEKDFINLTDAKEAALAFAKCYERCGSGTYKVRQSNAIIAYNYFVS